MLLDTEPSQELHPTDPSIVGKSVYISCGSTVHNSQQWPLTAKMYERAANEDFKYLLRFYDTE